MPIVGLPLDEFATLLGRELPADQLEHELHRFGCSVEGWATIRRWRCACCGALSDSAEELAPPECESCGSDFRLSGQEPDPAGESRVLRMELLAVRPDLFDPAGLARALRGFLGLEEGAPGYRVVAGDRVIEASPVAVRPRIVAGIVRDVELDDARLRSLMKLQENVHWALGRDRKLASIGAYDLARVDESRFVYREVGPEEIRFVPLGLSPDQEGNRWTPRQILELHPKGRAFARLLAGAKAYPLLGSAAGSVLSMPPIINSEATRVTTNTRDVIVDVTGLEDRHIERALNIVVTSLLESCPGSYVETCEIRYVGGESRRTPDLAPHRFELDATEASRLIGVEFDARRLAQLLQRMRHDASEAGGARVAVDVPAWRADVMHPRDLMEDAAIAWGYDRIPEQPLQSATSARASGRELAAARARAALAGLGCLEVLTLALTSEETSFSRVGLPNEGRHVLLENPISVEQTMLRVSLLPGLLETLAINLGHPYPQRLFEVGLVTRLDDSSETGASEILHAALALAGDGLGYADVRAAVDTLLAEVSGAPAEAIRYVPLDEPVFLAGRGAAVVAGGRRVGRLGEVSPSVLEQFRIIHPVVLGEIDLEALERAAGAS